LRMKSAMIVHGTKCTLTTQNIMGLPQSIRYSSLLNRQITSLNSCSPTPKAEIIKSGISAPIKATIKSPPSNEKDILPYKALPPFKRIVSIKSKLKVSCAAFGMGKS
jgi:hypothetical protein